MTNGIFCFLKNDCLSPVVDLDGWPEGMGRVRKELAPPAVKKVLLLAGGGLHQQGEILSYSLSEQPDMAMVMSMLGGLFSRFPDVSGMMLHSDQGWPYRMDCYRRALRDHGVIQSMSRKGNCLDNAGTENLFSVMKKEMFYGHEKEFRSFAEFRDRLDEYVAWYNTERIKQRIGGAPVFHRSLHALPLPC
jgi:hypothetical protein